MRSSLQILSLLAAVASAHFTLSYPPSRGDNDETQASGPCGGLNTPSKVRTPWPLTGGQLSFVAGHDEANTAVYLAIGNNPTTEDYKIILADKFLQIGLGDFCWKDLAVPAGTEGVKEGVNATIQVVQQGHTSGGLYNCADITFEKSPPTISAGCKNGTGVSAEPASSSSTPSSSSTKNGTAAPTATKSGQPSTTSKSAAEKLKVVGGSLFAGALACAGMML